MHALSIAGSDPSSGAGIQGDLKTYFSLGVYGLTVVTAITSQNTSKFSKVEEISPPMIQSQIESILSDFDVDIIKIGMVYSSKIIKVIHSSLRGKKIPIVLDPIFESSTGGILLEKNALSDFVKLLVPLSFVITPNIPEAERLAKIKIRNQKDVRKAAIKIQQMGAKNVIIKGGHLNKDAVTDFILEGSQFYKFSAKRIQHKTHGGGCNFSASLCANLAKGRDLKDSVRFAKEFATQSINNSQKIGKGLFVVKVKNTDIIEKELSSAILGFINIKYIYQFIPECQTNFVFSKPQPKSLNDILGISGRIVKAGKDVILAGNLKYGGSRHVASAILEITKKFPNTRSAFNIKYDKELIKKAISKKLSVSHYDRAAESLKTKAKEGHTISWGISDAIKHITQPPDLIFHKGGLGKEPMILIFGTTPKQALATIAKII